MLYAYDLDGVLVDTEQANREAYLTLGIIPPKNFHQRHWTTWVSGKDHDRKNKILPMRKNLIKALPMLKFALAHPGPVYTMCSHPAFDLIMDVVPDMRYMTTWFVTQEERLNALKNDAPITYFDDNPEFCKLAAQTEGITVCQVYPSS